MPSKLDQFLDTDEAVVYRSIGRSDANDKWELLAALLSAMFVFLALDYTDSSLHGEPENGLRWVLMMYALPVIVIGPLYWIASRVMARLKDRNPDVVVVTRLRVFYRTKSEGTVDSMGLAEIWDLSWSMGR